MAWAAIAMQAAGGTVGAYSQLKQGKEQQAQLEWEARQARLKAADALQRGEMEAAQIRTKGSQAVGEIRAEQGASGLDVSSGTLASQTGNVRAFSELDALMTRTNAAREAWKLENEAKGLDWAAKQTKIQSRLGALGSFLGGASSAAGSYYNYYGRGSGSEK